MPDPAEQLQKIYLAGFELQSLERFPTAVGVVKGNCMVLLQATPTGLQPIGQPGWRLGDVLGVLVEKEGKRVFQNKLNVVEATPERLAELDTFRQELENLLAPTA
ncbi:MAG: hypothetical protein ABR866_09040 [Candidatus Korobacteraceae bacterium]|jgi:hypothetical protein